MIFYPCKHFGHLISLSVLSPDTLYETSTSFFNGPILLIHYPFATCLLFWGYLSFLGNGIWVLENKNPECTGHYLSKTNWCPQFPNTGWVVNMNFLEWWLIWFFLIIHFLDFLVSWKSNTHIFKETCSGFAKPTGKVIVINEELTP